MTIRYQWGFDGDLKEFFDSPTEPKSEREVIPYNGGPTFVNGMIGQSGYFDGTVGATLLTDETFQEFEDKACFSLWFKSDTTTGTTDARIITRDQSDYWALKLDQNAAGSQTLKFMIKGTVRYTGSATQTDWHNIVFGYNRIGTYAFVAIDGVKVYENFSESITWINNVRDLFICGNIEDVPDGSYMFKGMIDDIKLYDDMLNITEIEELYDVGVGHWSLDQNFDDDLYGINSTVSGAPVESNVTMVYDNSYLFNGSTDYVTSNPPTGQFDLRVNNKFSVAVWANAYADTKILSLDGSFSLTLGTNIDFWMMDVDDVTNSTLTTDNIYSLTTWYHIVAVYDGTKRHIYVNNTLVKSDTVAINYNVNEGTNFVIAGGASGFNGLISDVRLFNSAISQTKITNLYQTRAYMQKDGRLYGKTFKESAHGSIQESTRWMVLDDSIVVASYDYEGSNVGDTGVTMVYLNGEYVDYMERNEILLVDNSVAGAGSILSTSKPVSLGGTRTGTPFVWRGRKFAHYFNRNEPNYAHIMPLGDGTLKVYEGLTGAPVQTLTMVSTEYQVVICPLDDTVYRFEANNDFLVFYNSTSNFDSLPGYPASREIYGVSGGTSSISGTEDNTSYTIYYSDGTTSSGTITNKGTAVSITGVGWYSGASLRIIADKPINCYAHGDGDGDGSDGTEFAAKESFGKEFVIPHSADWLVFVGLVDGATIDVYDNLDVLQYSHTVATSGSTVEGLKYPTKTKIIPVDLTSGVIGAGYRVICSDSQYGLYQMNSTQKETMLFGAYGDYGKSVQMPSIKGVIESHTLDEFIINSGTVKNDKVSINIDGTLRATEFIEN